MAEPGSREGAHPPHRRDRGPTRRGLAADRRAVSPAVAKTLEAGIVLLYVALVATVVLGGVVPGYRTAAGAAVGDRALVVGAHGVEDAVPAVGTNVRVERAVSLPVTIRGRTYAVVADGRSLVLEHPDPGIEGRVALAVPATVVSIAGRWESQRPATVVVTGNASAWRVRLENGGGG